MQNLPAGISPHKPGNLPILRSPKSKKDHEVAMGFSLQKKLWNNHNSSLQNKLFRWLRTFNVTTASHARQQKVADEWSGDGLIVEVAPFQSDIYWSLRNLLGFMGIYWWFTFSYNELPRWLGKVLLFPWKIICVRNLYCESIWISLSTLKIDDFKITLIYGIPAKKVHQSTPKAGISVLNLETKCLYNIASLKIAKFM